MSIARALKRAQLAARLSANVYIGRIVRAGLGFGVSLILARVLGPEDFGLFSFFIVTVVIGMNVLGEGLDPGVVRYYSRFAHSGASNPASVLSTGLFIRSLLGALAVVLLLVEDGWIAENVFSNPSYDVPFRIGIVGAVVAALWSFSLAGYQAKEKFGIYAILMPLANLLRLFAILFLLTTCLLSLETVIWSTVASFFLIAVAGIWGLREDLHYNLIKLVVFRDLVRFSKWTIVSSLFFVLQANLGVPALGYLANAHEAGIFAAGMSLLLIIDQLTVAILTVQLPAVSKVVNALGYRKYVGRTLPLSLVAALLLSPLIFLARPIIILIYGEAYEAAVGVFEILVGGFLATLVTHPLHLVFLSMNRPQIYTATTALSLSAWIAFALYLIPSLGAEGAAWASLVARLIQAALIVGVLWVVLALESRTKTG